MFHHDLTHSGTSPYVGSPNGVLKWKYSTIISAHPGAYYSSPAIGADGTVYIGSDSGTFCVGSCQPSDGLYALNPDGTFKWKFTTFSNVDSTPAIGPDGTIYVGSWDGNFYAITPNGYLKWEYSPGQPGYVVDSSPAVGSDGTIYFGDSNLNLYALKPDGSLKWKYGGISPYATSPAIGPDGTIYIGGYDCCEKFGSIHAINPDGTRKWVYSTPGEVKSSPAISTGGTIYVGSVDHNLYAINPGGTLKWNFTTGDAITSSPAIGLGGTIYVGSYDGQLYAINPDGSLKWKFAAGGPVDYSSPAIDHDGIIYFGSNDNSLYAVTPSGTQQWKYTTGGLVRSSPAIGSDGTVYVGSNDNTLYAFYGPPSDVSPIASFTFSPATPVRGEAISFDGSTSFDPDGTITSYSWSFGDGTPPSFGVLTTHSYATPKTYHVSLTVTDNANLTGTLSNDITVSPIRAHLNVTSDPPGCNVQGGGDYDGGTNATLKASGSCEDRAFSHWIIDGTSTATSNGKLVSTFYLVMNQNHNATAVYISQQDWIDFIDNIQNYGLQTLLNADSLRSYVDTARAGIPSEEEEMVVDASTPGILKGLAVAGFVISLAIQVDKIYAIEQDDSLSLDQKQQKLTEILGEQITYIACQVAVTVITSGVAAFVGGAACSYLSSYLYDDIIEPYGPVLIQWASDQLHQIWDAIWKDFQASSHLLHGLYRNVITFVFGSETTVVVIDSSGRRLGGISSTGEVVREIPNSIYSGIGTFPQQFAIANPLTNNYKIHVTNLQEGPVHLSSTVYTNWGKAGSTEYVQTLSKGDFDYTFNPQTITFVPPPGPWWTSPLVIAVAIVAAGAMITVAVWRLPNRIRKTLTLPQKSNACYSASIFQIIALSRISVYNQSRTNEMSVDW